ncbi:hypothetical protein [Tenacibaculum sp. 47A_GOM-205m]|uniref:hypothetical protein n=1 Tax=Tenacibaculum sp. 47A_GOM-205m TaxID=1380384 RepID=UPI0004ACA151|nr:hypothetical protein [Tenacibaculum sp. 47A_GOM-205m]
MVYSLLSIIAGIVILYFVFKLHKKDNNLWDISTSFGGLIGGVTLTIVGLITLFKGWG